MKFICLSLIALAIQTFAAAHLLAAEPTIEALIAGVPLLSPDNEQLSRFQCTFETPLPFEVPLVAVLKWNRPDDFYMVASAGEERTPFWFLSEKKSMMFDVSTGKVVLGEEAGPRCIIRAGEEKYTIEYSLTSFEKTEVAIDLRSFLAQPANDGRLERDSDGNWRLTTFSKSGKSKVSAVFEDSTKFPILSLETRSSKDDSLAFAIRDIAVNEQVDTAWPLFPAKESLPGALEIIELRDHKVEAVADGVEVVAQGIRTIMAQGALRNAKWRNVPYLFDVDWEDARRINSEFGPSLRALLNAKRPGSTDSESE